MQLYPTAETHTNVRRRNRFAVLSLLRQYGTLAKSDLVRLTHRTVTTIATIVDELLDEGLVETVNEPDPCPVGEIGRGRPASFYALNSRRWIVAGIEITSDKVIGALLNLNGQVVDTISVSAPSHLPADTVLQLASDLLHDLVSRAVSDTTSLLGIGIALEGIVDITAGKSLWMLFRNNWHDIPVVAHFEQHFDVPVLLEYRVFAAALAEAIYGAARGISDFAYLNVDTGVAVATVASGRLVRSSVGPTGVTGGLGHVLTTNGTRVCDCGKIGCLQAEITTQALVMQLQEMLDAKQKSAVSPFWQTHEARLDNLLAAVQKGDPLALELRSRFAKNLEIAASSTAQLFTANMMILGGTAIRFGGDEALKAAHRAVQSLTSLHNHFGMMKIIASSLLPDPATVGAATLVIQAVLEGQIGVRQMQIAS